MSYYVAYVKDKNSGNKKMQRDWQVCLIHQFLLAIFECQIIKGLKHYKYWRIVSLTATSVGLYMIYHLQFPCTISTLIYKSFVITRPVCDQWMTILIKSLCTHYLAILYRKPLKFAIQEDPIIIIHRYLIKLYGFMYETSRLNARNWFSSKWSIFTHIIDSPFAFFTIKVTCMYT